MKKIIILTFLISTPLYASDWYTKCGADLGEKGLTVSQRLSDYMGTQRIPKNLGFALNNYLNLAKTSVYEKKALQKIDITCGMLEKAIDSTNEALNYFEDDKVIDKICRNFK